MKTHFTMASLIAVSTIFAISEPQKQQFSPLQLEESVDLLAIETFDILTIRRVPRDDDGEEARDYDGDRRRNERNQKDDGRAPVDYDWDRNANDKKRREEDIRGERDYDGRDKGYIGGGRIDVDVAKWT